jgi:hypothetical protein
MVHVAGSALGRRRWIVGWLVAVAGAVSSVVDLAARRSRQAARSSAEAETLSLLATSVLRGENALPTLLQRVRETFGVRSVTLLERTGGGSATGWWRKPPSSAVCPVRRSVMNSPAAPGWTRWTWRPSRPRPRSP